MLTFSLIPGASPFTPVTLLIHQYALAMSICPAAVLKSFFQHQCHRAGLSLLRLPTATCAVRSEHCRGNGGRALWLSAKCHKSKSSKDQVPPTVTTAPKCLGQGSQETAEQFLRRLPVLWALLYAYSFSSYTLRTYYELYCRLLVASGQSRNQECSSPFNQKQSCNCV